MHTPGPWHNDNYVIKAANDYAVAVIPYPAHLRNAATTADARLITAAPDLLAAILSSDPAHWTPAMVAAIAKAISWQ
jgi:hypothetical protein